MTSLSLMSENKPAPTEWRQWLELHAPKLLLFARQQTRSREDAEDVLQDALVKLMDKLRNDQFIGGSDAWQSYLYATIRRLAIDLGRRDDRQRHIHANYRHMTKAQYGERRVVHFRKPRGA